MSRSLRRILVTAGAVAGASFALAGCQQSETPAEMPVTATDTSPVEAAMPDSSAAMPAVPTLPSVLAAQPAEAQARYVYRHPAETLAFFAIEPGMTVLEALPGGGWYTKILVPYLGSDGTLVGVDYSPALFPLFGFMSDDALKAKETWVEDWVLEARGWFDSDVAAIEAFQFGSLPEGMSGDADAALFIRALHNLARFEAEGGFLTEALAETYAALKPGGVVGVVQHMAPEDAPDAWADGSAGYLKKSFVIAQFEEAGFELVDETDINVNPLDQPTVDDIVWRLPPSLSTSRDDPELAEALKAIGESTRMTLLFRKPA